MEFSCLVCCLCFFFRLQVVTGYAPNELSGLRSRIDLPLILQRACALVLAAAAGTTGECGGEGERGRNAVGRLRGRRRGKERGRGRRENQDGDEVEDNDDDEGEEMAEEDDNEDGEEADSILAKVSRRVVSVISREGFLLDRGVLGESPASIRLCTDKRDSGVGREGTVTTPTPSHSEPGSISSISDVEAVAELAASVVAVLASGGSVTENGYRPGLASAGTANGINAGPGMSASTCASGTSSSPHYPPLSRLPFPRVLLPAEFVQVRRDLESRIFAGRKHLRSFYLYSFCFLYTHPIGPVCNSRIVVSAHPPAGPGPRPPPLSSQIRLRGSGK